MNRSVLMVSHFVPPAYSGAGLQAARLAAALVARGVDVRLLSLGGAVVPRRGSLDGVDVIRYPLPAGGRFRQAYLAAAAVSHLAGHPTRYSIAHLHGTFRTLHVLARLRSLLGFRLVYKPTMAGKDDASVVAARAPAALHAVDAWACVSAEIADAALAAGVPAERIFAAPNGVDLELFRPGAADDRSALRASLRVAESTRVWVLAGALVPRKRVELALESWARVPAPRPLLVLAGPTEAPAADAAYAAWIAETIGRLGLSGDVVLAGEQHMPTLLAACDGLVLVSTAEGLPNAPLEALACGVPVVLARAPGAADVERLGGALVHVVAGSPEALALAVAGAPSAGRRPDGIAALDVASLAARYQDLYERLEAAPGRKAAVGV